MNEKRTPPPIDGGWVDYPGTWEEFKQASDIKHAEIEERVTKQRRELQGLKIVTWKDLEQSPKERDALIERISAIFKRDIKPKELEELAVRLKEKEDRVMTELEATGKFDESGLSLPSIILLRLMHPVCVELQIRLDGSTYTKLAKAAIHYISSRL